MVLPQKKDKRFLQKVRVPPAYVDDIEKLPIPNRKYISHINYRSVIGVSNKLATMISSRGCPYKCTFCDIPIKSHRKRSPESVIDEMQVCLDMGYDEIHFYDDLFNITPQRLIDICDEINVSLSFGCTEGTCGVCELTVVDGSKNLSKVSEEEKEYLLPEDLQAGMRLGCQLKIRKGNVTFTWKTNKA